MHLPDGFLDAKTWVSTSIISTCALGYAITKTKEVLSDRQIPRMGVMAAFIFAAQMVNIPIAGGTSGHLLGGALAAITMGPWSAALIISTVLVIQCLFFQDGGLTTLGGNILLMAIVAPLTAHFTYRLLASYSQNRIRVLVSTFISGWTSTMVASVLASVLLAVSGTVPLYVALPAMSGWHAFIGIIEGLITAFVIGFLIRVKANLIFHSEKV